MLIPRFPDPATNTSVNPFHRIQYWSPGRNVTFCVCHTQYICSLSSPFARCALPRGYIPCGNCRDALIKHCRFVAHSPPVQNSGRRVSWGIRWKASVALAGQACVALKAQFPETPNRLLTLLVFMSSRCKDPQPRILPRLKNHSPGPAFPSSQLQDSLLEVMYE